MRVLSVFADESGYFGSYNHRSPYYLLSLVFHDQDVDVAREIPFLERALARNGFPQDHAVHTAPLVRREAPYENTDPDVRRNLFDALFNFYIHCDITTKTILVEKRKFGCGDDLAERIAHELGLFIRERLAWFQSFDRVIVYYDRGQKQVTRTLRLIFRSNLSDVEFRVVHPDGYRLFQVADLVCTLELVKRKLADGALSKSEREFFRNAARLKKNYLKHLAHKRNEGGIAASRLYS